MPKLLIVLLSLSIHFVNGQQKENATLYFEFANATLTNSSADSMQSLLNKLGKQPPSKIIINGYADKTGSATYNATLSQERADSIGLLLKHALPKEVEILVNSFGSNDLVSEKEDEQYLNRRTEIYIQYAVVKETITQLEPFNEDVDEQHFTINLDDTVVVRARGGTVIKIAPQSIQNRSGMLVKGNADLLIKEYYNADDIILAGMHTNSDKGLLQTGGMIYMSLVQHGDTMDTKTKKPVEIKMPVINPELNNMNVFAFHNNDSTQWKNTGVSFSQLKSYWLWNYSKATWDITVSDQTLTNLPVGKTDDMEYRTESVFALFCWNLFRPFAKKIKLNLTKVDSNTVRVHAQIKYRLRGVLAVGKKRLDTTFKVTYMRSSYDGITDNMNFINCDRFLQSDEKMDLYVNTPGYAGTNVVLYFKGIRSFMPAGFNNNKYFVPGIPSYMPVVAVAIGKNGDDYYFGKTEFTTKPGTIPSISITKTDKEGLKNAMKHL